MSIRTQPIVFLLAAAGGSVCAQDWPQWRGPAADGVAPQQEVPQHWDRDTNVKWRTPLAHAGNGSPIVSRGRVFVTMPEDDEGKGRSLYCFDRKTGEQQWVRTVRFEEAMPTHETNPHCSTTPASDGERVVVWHASAGLFCYDHGGELLWQRDLGEFRHQWGHGTSPILHDGKVLLHTGPGQQSFVAAFDLEDGATAWRTDEPSQLTPEQVEKKRLAGSWCTPIVRSVGDRDLVLCGQPTRVVAYDVADGGIVWWCSGVSSSRGDLTYSSPVVTDAVCMIVGGWVGPSLGVRIDGEGDVTESHRVWHQPETITNCASGVHVDGAIYIPDMRSIVSCVDAASGETLWRARVGRGNTWGSFVHADGKLFLTNQSGTTRVLEPNRERKVVLAENKLKEQTNATPAISEGEIFLRTFDALYCIAMP
ncbi:MAG: PQQ-binding-like beta-propeller repeat protein [Planctomycetota bacterium]